MSRLLCHLCKFWVEEAVIGSKEAQRLFTAHALTAHDAPARILVLPKAPKSCRHCGLDADEPIHTGGHPTRCHKFEAPPVVDVLSEVCALVHGWRSGVGSADEAMNAISRLLPVGGK